METTSLESYGNLRASGLLTKQQHIVLQALKRHGASTASELTAAIQRERSSPPDPSWQKRLSELQRKGVVEKLPPRACRVTKNSAAVWRAASSGNNPPVSGSIPSTLLAATPLAPQAVPTVSLPSVVAATFPDVQCGCGRKTAVAMCRTCGPYCAAFGHAAHSCGGGR